MRCVTFLWRAAEIVTRELAEAMLAISEEIRREVAVFIDRSGQVLMVSVGQADKAPVLALSKRRWQYGYAGVRCVHTHPGATAHLSEPDISALKNLRYDAMIAIARPEGKLRASVAMLEPVDGMLADARVVGAEDLDWATFTRLAAGRSAFALRRLAGAAEYRRHWLGERARHSHPPA